MTILDFPLWLRATHCLTLLFISLLVRSGLAILSAHPKLYGNDHGAPGSEFIVFHALDDTSTSEPDPAGPGCCYGTISIAVASDPQT